MADRPTERRCHTCGPTATEPHPNQPSVTRCANCKEHRPTAFPRQTDVPLDRLRNLVDRACRHLTPAEGTALREALAGTVHNATTAAAGLHQRAADAEARADASEEQRTTYRDAWHSAKDRVRKAIAERDIARHELTNQRETFTIAYDALTERAVRAEQQLAQARARITAMHPEALDSPHCARCGVLHPCPTVAALDAQQPETAGERELRPCGQPNCLPNGAHRYMLGRRIHQCPGAEPARQNGQEGATAATTATDNPEHAEHPNGPHTGAHDR